MIVQDGELASKHRHLDYEKPCTFLSSDLISILTSIIEVGKVGHLLTQAVGWEYTLLRKTNEIRRRQSSNVHTVSGRKYWSHHLRSLTDYAIHFGSQMCLIPDFIEGDCVFCHRLYSRSAAM